MTQVTVQPDGTPIVPSIPAADRPVSLTESPRYTSAVIGEFAPGVTPKQLPNIPCKLVRFKGRSANPGRVCIGNDSQTSLPTGADDTTSGWELGSGDDTGWLPVDNLNRFWAIGVNASDSLLYWVLT